MKTINDIPSGVSMESALYMENNIKFRRKHYNTANSNEIIEEYTPKLFSKSKVFKKSDSRN